MLKSTKPFTWKLRVRDEMEDLGEGGEEELSAADPASTPDKDI